MKFREQFLKKQLMYLLILFGIFAFLHIARIASENPVYYGHSYTRARDVALYLKEYHNLPYNYITKYDMEYYEDNGIILEDAVVGGDDYHDYERKLRRFGISENRELCECDIYEEGYEAISTKRGTHRFVYTVDKSKFRVFETKDHYETFREFTKFETRLFYNICSIIYFSHIIGTSVIIVFVYFPNIFSKNKKDNKKVDNIE